MAGGFELALLCDVRFAATGTQFGLPDTRLGLSPTSGMTWLLPRIIGLGRALSLTLSAEPIDAEEALRIGLGQPGRRTGDAVCRGRGVRPSAGRVSAARRDQDQARIPGRPR